MEATRRGSEGDGEPVVDRPKGVGYGRYVSVLSLDLCLLCEYTS